LKLNISTIYYEPRVWQYNTGKTAMIMKHKYTDIENATPLIIEKSYNSI